MAQHGNPDQDTRDSRGQYARSLTAAQRYAAAAQLRSEGLTYQEIADELGYSDKRTAWNAVRRLIDSLTIPAAESARKTEVERLELEFERLDGELDRLDALVPHVETVLKRHHITVNNGKVITLPNSETGVEEPLLDDGPVLAAVDRLTRIAAERRAISDTRRRHSESYRKLLGIDAPTRVDATVHEVTQQDLELQEMLRDAKTQTATEEQAIRDGEA